MVMCFLLHELLYVVYPHGVLSGGEEKLTLDEKAECYGGAQLP